MTEGNFKHDDFKEEREMLKSCYRRCFWSFVSMILIGALGYFLASCTTTKYVPVEVVKTEYKTRTDSFIQTDSIFVKDSVFIHSKGDTVWMEKWHTKYVDRVRDVVHTDSFIKRDSIPVPYPVERKLSRWEQTKIDWGGEAIVATIVVLFILVVSIVRWLRRKLLRK